jgi:BNR/Asp-box repeat
MRIGSITPWRPMKSLLVISAGVALVAGVVPAVAASDVLVTNGSPSTTFSQNKQNEPAIAVDANNPSVLAAGSNDEIDLAPCNGNSCPFTPGIGVSGIYFSFDSGATWTQPTYTGRSARTGTTITGPIGTLPNYAEAGLTSDGDPALAFGPAPSNGVFSWGNGSRLYYANLTSNLFAKRNETFKGFEGIAVSHTDNLAAAAAGTNSAWSAPVIASQQSSTTFSDKEQIWADNAASSPFFGNVYVCNAAFRSQEKSAHAVPAPLMLLKSTDGGSTWTSLQISSAVNNGQLNPPDGCTIRTDSHGVVYVFGLGSGSNKQIGELLSRSFDGGKTFEPFRFLFPVVKPGVFDAALGRPVMDGIAGARADLAAAPSVDIANGAPSGADATNELLLNWSDARDGLNNEKSMLSYSTDRGQTWSAATAVSSSPDRPIYTAIAISPNGTDAYLTYDAYLTPYRTDTTSLRQLQGVVKHADIGAGGAPTAFSDLNRGVVGDPRGSSQNGLTAEFLGDYVYATATRTYGAAVWNDTRNAADCPAIDTYRAGIEAGTNPTAPAPLTDCPPTWGNSDIFGGAYPDPTP